jgi:hypothetical protein
MCTLRSTATVDLEPVWASTFIFRSNLKRIHLGLLRPCGVVRLRASPRQVLQTSPGVANSDPTWHFSPTTRLFLGGHVRLLQRAQTREIPYLHLNLWQRNLWLGSLGADIRPLRSNENAGTRNKSSRRASRYIMRDTRLQRHP